MQRARNRRGRKRQHVNVAAQAFERLFLVHAKMLFLVDDQQAEIFEVDALLQHGMGADDDIHLAVVDVGNGFLRLLRRHHA